MRPGDGDVEPEPHQLREHFRPRDDRNLPPRGFPDLGVGGPHRGGDDHHLRVSDVRRFVRAGDADAQRLQPIGDRRPLLVRSTDDVAQIGEQLGDATHANAANPDEVHVARLAQHGPRPQALAGQRQRAIDNHASRRPRQRASCPRHADPCVAIADQRQHLSGQNASAGHCSTRPPVSASASAFRRRIVGRRRQRNQNRSLARRRISASVGAGAADDHVRLSKPPSHAVQERLDFGRKFCAGRLRALSTSRSPVWWVMMRESAAIPPLPTMAR